MPPLDDRLLELLETRFAEDGDLFTVASGGLYVADPWHAKQILANAEGHYVEHSDFFHTSAGVLGPREIQQRIGREARELLAGFIQSSAGRLDGLVESHLWPSSRLPDAANHLLADYFRPALLATHTSSRLPAALTDVVKHAVLAGARERRRRWQRALLRRRAHGLLAAEIVARRRESGPAADLLGVVALATAPTHPPEQAGEVFLSLLFATTGSVGFLLAWSLFLLGQHEPPGQIPLSATVREALRLWPVAWLFGRVAARRHRIGPAVVEPGETVSVCTYLVHRHPAHWPEPNTFQPQRWGGANPAAFLPFGWGPHACTGAALSLGLVEELLRVITDRYHLSVAVDDPRPHTGPALAPPEFVLSLSTRAQRGGEER
ncbi:cytochrome P450 [Rhizocola hellebori]|uniref:cytochrome P450 n=1 Tax=Rhizocola hellebori TaxID=1392758 RepID=UPI0019447B13|nr:cytochrome P450 [Rhizocola hellebori]